MVRELNMDTQRQDFWKQSIDKEANVRLGWHMKYSKEFANESFLPQIKKKHTVPKPMVKDLELINSMKKKKDKKPRMKKVDVNLDTANDSSTLLIEMRPVSSKTKDLLYKGFSALGEGRYAYLKERKQKQPELKYEYPVTSTWEYGWKITDTMKRSSMKPSTFGRTRIVQDTFYSRNGVLPLDVVNTAFL